MGMIYTASFTDVAISALQDLFELTAPSDAVVILHSCYIFQNSDFGDAAAEGLTINITRYSTSGSGGTAPTERPHEVGFPASGSAVEVNNTTQGGTPVVLFSEGFNVQAGWAHRPTPEERYVTSPSGIIAIELPTAPADALTVSGSLTFEEIGG